MSLGLDVRTKGRVGTALPTVLSVRTLSSEEVVRASAREAGTKAPPLERVSERHRQLARLLVAGMPPGAAAAQMGLSASRVSILIADPTFQELIARLRIEKDTALYGMHERLGVAGVTSLDILIERMEEDPEQFTVDELALITRLAADRTGFGPSKTETKNLNVNFGDQLEAARLRAQKALPVPLADVVDVDFEEVS